MSSWEKAAWRPPTPSPNAPFRPHPPTSTVRQLTHFEVELGVRRLAPLDHAEGA